MLKCTRALRDNFSLNHWLYVENKQGIVRDLSYSSDTVVRLPWDHWVSYSICVNIFLIAVKYKFKIIFNKGYTHSVLFTDEMQTLWYVALNISIISGQPFAFRTLKMQNRQQWPQLWHIQWTDTRELAREEGSRQRNTRGSRAGACPDESYGTRLISPMKRNKLSIWEAP